MEAETGLRSQRCNDLTRNFRVGHEASPCLANHLAAKEAEAAGEWTTQQIGVASGLGAAAIAMTILSLVLGALLLKKCAGMKKASSRVESMERPFVPESQKDLS